MKYLALLLGALLPFTLASCHDDTRPVASSNHSGLARSPTNLFFNVAGQAALPKGYRSWVHAVTSWSPIGKTPISPQPTETPEFHNVYVEPNAYRGYMKTGRWPEGAILVKEFAQTSVDPGNCDGPPAFICNASFGKTILDHGQIGIAVMLKDTGRFPHEPGGWAYFDYGHQPPPYQSYAAPHSRAECAQCHIDHAGPDRDYVFSTDRPGLSRAGEDAKLNLEAAFPED